MKAISTEYGRYFTFISSIIVPSIRKPSIKTDGMSGWLLFKYHKVYLFMSSQRLY